MKGHVLDVRENLVYADDNLVALIVYTGALDQFFDCKYGKLPYRSLKFEWHYEEVESFQDAPVVAYPQANGHTRITEYKKLPVRNINGTIYAVEYPLPYKKEENMEPYYPLLTEESQLLYKSYKSEANAINNMVCCGRLADFKYYNMDQALERALYVAHSKKVKRILGT